jgi:hypothetical protein
MQKSKNNKLAIPEWFKVEAYAPFSRLTKSQDWLEQFAVRIDLKRLLKYVTENHDNPFSQGKSKGIEEFYVEDILGMIRQNPVLPIDEIVTDYTTCNFIFSTVSFIRRDLAPVRAMTMLDLYWAELMIEPAERYLMRQFSHRLERESRAKNDVSSDRIAGDDHAESSWMTAPKTYQHNRQALKHQKHMLEMLELKKAHDPSWIDHPTTRIAGLYSDFMESPITMNSPQATTTFFAVDPNIPLKNAVIAFRKLFKQHAAGKMQDKHLNDVDYGSWCNHRVMPYIDLKIIEAFERIKQRNDNIAIVESSICAEIYRGKRYESIRVSETTKCFAASFLNPASFDFRILLAHAQNSANCENTNKA